MSHSLTRDSAFSYVCNQCCRCCYDKRIPVNPYEIARLSRHFEISTGLFIQRYIETDGPYLTSRDDGSCIFLNEDGCSVHEDRPLVCRLYPLARRVDAEGDETFFEVTPHPETCGVYGRSSTVDEYLTFQDAENFTEAADRYHALVNKLLSVIQESDTGNDVKDGLSWLDMDAALQKCPQDVVDELTARMEAHIDFIWSSAIQTIHQQELDDEKEKQS